MPMGDETIPEKVNPAPTSVRGGLAERLGPIALIAGGTVLVLAPLISEGHARTLTANALPFLLTEIYRPGGANYPQSVEQVTDAFKRRMDGGVALEFYYMFCFALGCAMIAAAIRRIRKLASRAAGP